jgi:hypothetical protein
LHWRRELLRWLRRYNRSRSQLPTAGRFKGAAEIQTGPAGTSNCLLVNAPPAVFDEVTKTLEKLDRRPHSVAVEVFVVELATKKADDKDKQRPDEKDFSGAIDEVTEPLNAMMKNGQVTGFKRIQFSTLEGRLGVLNQNEFKRFATGENDLDKAVARLGEIVRQQFDKGEGNAG